MTLLHSVLPLRGRGAHPAWPVSPLPGGSHHAIILTTDPPPPRRGPCWPQPVCPAWLCLPLALRSWLLTDEFIHGQFPPREPWSDPNSHRGCSAARPSPLAPVWWMTWSPEEEPASPALVWEEAAVGGQTWQPHAEWSTCTGQHPQVREATSLLTCPAQRHWKSWEFPSDNPSHPRAHIPGTRQPLSLFLFYFFLLSMTIYFQKACTLKSVSFFKKFLY